MVEPVNRNGIKMDVGRETFVRTLSLMRGKNWQFFKPDKTWEHADYSDHSWKENAFKSLTSPVSLLWWRSKWGWWSSNNPSPKKVHVYNLPECVWRPAAILQTRQPQLLPEQRHQHVLLWSNYPKQHHHHQQSDHIYLDFICRTQCLGHGIAPRK